MTIETIEDLCKAAEENSPAPFILQPKSPGGVLIVAWDVQMLRKFEDLNKHCESLKDKLAAKGTTYQ
jgi:hypothetical protein